MRLKTVIVYQCDTCKRKTGLFQNNQGLDVVSRCIITQDCKGTLRKVGEKQQPFIEPNAPDANGLEDWSKRPSYFRHEQTSALRTWRIKHNLNGHPSVRVFVEKESDTFTIVNVSPSVDGYFLVSGNYTGAFKNGVKFILEKQSGTQVTLTTITSTFDPATNRTTIRTREAITFLGVVGGVNKDKIILGTNGSKTLVPTTPDKITCISPYQLEISFATPVAGIAECLIRNITQITVEDQKAEEPTLRQIISANSIVTIATEENAPSLNYDLQFISPIDNKTSVRRTMTFTLSQIYLSPWSNIAKTVLVNGKRYYVRAANVVSLFDNVEDKSLFYIVASTSSPGNIGTTLFLISKPPHLNVDRDPSTWVYMSDLNSTNSSKTLYENGVLSCTTDLFNTAYPPIRILS